TEAGQVKGRRSGRSSLHHCLRKLLLLQETTLVALQQFQPELLDGGRNDGLLAVRPVRIYAHDGRICGWAGAVCARAFRGCRTDQSAGGDFRRESSIPFRYFSDWLLRRSDGGH